MMDRKARLSILLGGADSELIGLNTGRKSQLPPQTVPISSQPHEQISSVEATLVDPTSTSDIEDEYLQSVSRVSIPAETRRSRRTRPANGTASAVHQETAHISLKDSIQEDLQLGDFCPLLAVAKFPYKYVHGRVADKIAKAYFDQGKFFNRTWDLFYVQPPKSVSEKAILFVPLRQVEAFIELINESLSGDDVVSIPIDAETGFVTRFDQDGAPLPTFLGVSHSRNEKDELAERLVYPGESPDELPRGCSSKAFDVFTEKLERAYDAGRNKKRKGGRGHTSGEDQRSRLKGWIDSLRRTQQYLGLRPVVSNQAQTQTQFEPAPSWDSQQDQSASNTAVVKILPPLDTSRPPQYDMAKLPIFTCVDVESNELQHEQITEVGISTLDTADLIGLAPGDNGCNWYSKIKTRHFRVAEYAHVVNTRFMNGCPDRFQFGESEIVPLSQIVATVEACFKPPYKTATDPQQHTDATTRNLIFVGHEALSDLRYLRSLGCTSIFAPPPASDDKKSAAETQLSDMFIDQLDTNIFHRVLKREFNGTSLGNAINLLGITGWFLHNAGNDAHYTMQALVGLTLQSMVQRPEPGADRKDSPDAVFYPLVLGTPTITSNAAVAEAVTLARECEQRWTAEVQRRIDQADSDETATRIVAQCANWDAALSDSLSGGESATGKKKQRW